MSRRTMGKRTKARRRAKRSGAPPPLPPEVEAELYAAAEDFLAAMSAPWPAGPPEEGAP